MKRGARWEADSTPMPCKCGSSAPMLVNCRNRDRLFCQHNSPIGDLCLEWKWQQLKERTDRIVERALAPKASVHKGAAR